MKMEKEKTIKLKTPYSTPKWVKSKCSTYTGQWVSSDFPFSKSQPKSRSENRPTEPGTVFNSDNAEFLEYAVRQAFVGRLPRAVERIVLSFEGQDNSDTFSYKQAKVRIALKDPATGSHEVFSTWIREKVKVILNGVAPPVEVELMDLRRIQEWENSLLQDRLRANFISYERNRWIYAPGYQTADLFE